MHNKQIKHFSTDSKQKTEVKGQDLSRILKKAKGVWFALCPNKIRYVSHLSAQIKYLKSAVVPIFKLFPSWYESDLSNEVLCCLVVQRAAKLWRSKLEFWKRNFLIWPRYPRFRADLDLWDNLFSDLHFWTPIVWQPFELQGYIVPHLKDLIHICLELV